MGCAGPMGCEKTTACSSNPTSGHLSEENKSTNLKRPMDPHIHYIIIFNSLDMEATWEFPDTGVDKDSALYKYHGILLSCKREGNLAICDQIVRPRGHFTK